MSNLRPTQKQRQQVTLRAKGCCEYCLSQSRFSPDTFSIDHIVPRVAGGKTSLDNLALSCQRCNSKKHIKTAVFDLVTGQMVPLYHPRQHKWHEHFAWGTNLIHLVALTPIGRVTITTLELNRSGVVNLRRLLCAVDEHPPKIY